MIGLGSGVGFEAKGMLTSRRPALSGQHLPTSVVAGAWSWVKKSFLDAPAFQAILAANVQARSILTKRVLARKSCVKKRRESGTTLAMALVKRSDFESPKNRRLMRQRHRI